MRYDKKIWSKSAAKSHCDSRGGTFEAASNQQSSEQADISTLKIPIQQLQGEITLGASTSDKERRLSVTWYTGATVRRYSWGDTYNLTLSMNSKHVRMDRLKSGKAPVLDSHYDFRLKDVIGVVEKATIKDGKGFADIRFSERPEVEPIWNDIQNGIIRNASVGAAIHKLKDITEEEEKVKSYLAVDWEPLEISIVPIGADMDAGFKASEESRVTEAEIVSDSNQRADSAHIQGETTMPEEKTTDAGEKARTEQTTLTQAAEQELERSKNAGKDAERARVLTINETVKVLRLPQSFADYHIKTGTNIEIFRTLAIDERAKPTSPGNEPWGCTTPADDPRLQDETDRRRAGMVGALLERFEPRSWGWNERERSYIYDKKHSQELFEGARSFIGLSLLDVVKACLLNAGKRWQDKSRTEMVSLAFQSTSDFPHILANVANKSLRAGYDMMESQWRLIAARRTAADFKTAYELTLDQSSRLEKVPESGEFKRGALIEGRESWALSTYGKIIAVTRQAIINDDLGAFTRTPFLLGQEVAMLEADTVIGIITANGVLSDDVELFDADVHKNVVASGGAISIENLGATRVLLMTQTSPGGKPLGIVPRFLLAPAAIGQLAEQYCSPNYQAITAETINPMAGRLTPIIEPRLDAAAQDAAWYLFGDPNFPSATVLIYAYLEGQEGPYTENRQGFDVDGTEIKIRHDFAAAAVDYRGAVQNPGS